MANNDELFQQFIDDFKKLDLSSLDELYSQFHDFYLEQEFDKFFKKEIHDIQSQHIVCPDCGCEHITKAGFDQFGDQRYKCHNHECKRITFTLKRNTLMYYSKSSKQQWLIFFECLFHGETIKTTMDKVGICENTVLAWRHKTMYLIFKMLEHDKLEGEVEMDETLFGYHTKGKFKEIDVEKTKRRGISGDKISVACAVDEKGKMIIRVINRGRATSKSLIDTFDGYIDKSNLVISDSLRSYHKVQKTLGYEWIKIPSGKSSYKGYTLDRTNSLHGNLKMYIGHLRGVSVSFLQGYLSLYELIHRYPRYYQRKSYRDIVLKILTTTMHYRGSDFDETFSYV